VQNDDRVDWREAFELFRGDVAYVWHAGLYAGEVAASLKQAGFAIRSQIIWAKQRVAARVLRYSLLRASDYFWLRWELMLLSRNPLRARDRSIGVRMARGATETRVQLDCSQ
jgi:hypothetical protein